MNIIQNRNDIHSLVSAFYSKIRVNEVLGPIFNKHIAENEWPAHIDKLTNFWEMNLLGGKNFNGNPSQKHQNVDKGLNYGITTDHFGIWINLWIETINELFVGEKAEKAVFLARKMATGQYLYVWQRRPKTSDQ